MSSSIKASIATVKVGHLELQGLLGVDGKFYIALPQLASLNLVPPNRSQKQLEALLRSDPAKGFEFTKVMTTLNSKAVNTISLGDLNRLIVLLADRGNEKAREILGLPCRRAPKSNSDKGSIYVLHDRKNHGLKVGFSTDIPARLQGHKTSNPFAILCFTVKNQSPSDERAFHKKNRAESYGGLAEWYDDRNLPISGIASQFKSSDIEYPKSESLSLVGRSIMSSKSLDFGYYEIDSVMFDNGAFGFKLKDLAKGLRLEYGDFLDLLHENLGCLTTFRVSDGEVGSLCIDSSDYPLLMSVLKDVGHPVGLDYFEWSCKFSLLSFFQEAYCVEFDVLEELNLPENQDESNGRVLASKVLSLINERNRMEERLNLALSD